MFKMVNDGSGGPGQRVAMTDAEIAEIEALWATPKVRVPASVTTFQARAALMQAGLFDAVDAHCQAVGGATRQAWEYANRFYRNGALITSLAPTFGLTPEQVDALFIAAAAIEA